MLKRILLLLFIPIFCLGQKIEKIEFSVSDIDSLSKKETCFKISDFGYKIQVEKTFSDTNVRIIGEGYGGWKINAHFIDSLNYNNLSKEQKKRYNDKNTCIIIRADYLSSVSYEDKSIEMESIFFYFKRDEVFYVKYKKNSYSLNFYFNDMEKELADNQSLKEYLINKMNEVRKVWTNR